MRVLFNKCSALFINKSIFVLLMTQNLPFFSKQFNGIIWRMEIDEGTDIVYLEIRHPEDKLVTFAAVNLASEVTQFENITTPERWLTGIESAFGGVLLLHGYQGENAPVHKGLTAIGTNGKILWSNYSLSFDHLTINGPVTFAAQIQPRKLFLTDVITGLTIRPYNMEQDRGYENSVVYPQLTNSGGLNFTLPVESYNGVVHYLTYNNYRIVSLHTLAGGQLKQYLYVWAFDDLVYEDLLNENIQKMQPEAFIRYKNQIIYIKNKTELRFLKL